MHIFFLDFASQKKRFALVDETHVLESISIDDHSDENLLMPMVRKLIDGKDVQKIACVLGPGGFTSLRVGVALANALSFGLNIPSAGVHLSDLWAASVQEKDFLWLHSTRKTMLFVRGFGSFQSVWPEPVVIEIEALKEKISKKVPIVGELIPEHLETLREVIDILPIDSFDAALPTVLQSLEYVSGQTLLPWYGREA